MTTVEILYFAGCPAYRKARENVLKEVAATGGGVKLQMTLVRHAADAARLDFHGSPTLRINGVDIDAEGLSRATGTGLYSRSYRYKGRMYEAPPPEMIRDALSKLSGQGATAPR